MTPGTPDAVAGTSALNRSARPVSVRMMSALDRLVDAAGGRLGQRRAEHRDRGDQGQPDHQRRGGLGGAPRAAHGVLPAELPRLPSIRASGRPITPDTGRAIAGESMATPMNRQTAPGAYELDRRLGQADGQQDDAGDGEPRAPGNQAPQRAAAVGLPVAERGHGGDAHGVRVPGRSRRRASRRRRRRARPVRCAARTPADPGGSVTPNPLISALSPSAASTPTPMPITEETSPTIAASASTERNT